MQKLKTKTVANPVGATSSRPHFEGITKNKKGITLIALIITIIVMLILVGVTVSVSLNGGLFKTAKEATQKYGIEQLKEEVSLVLQTRNMNDRIGNNKNTLKQDLETIEGATVEQANDDMCYITRGDVTLTVYDNGDMYQGKVDLWDGQTTESPEFKDFNWYIYNCEQLKFFADFVNNGNVLTEEQKTIVAEAGYEESDITITEETIVYLMADLDLGARQNNGELTSGIAWTPIGTTKELTFIGTFEGNNHVIKGVYVNTTGNFAGLFGNSNTVQNLTIKDSYIKANVAAGGIVAVARGGNLLNCHNVNTTVISDTYTAGGIVGQFGSSSIDYEMIIRDCTNSGKIRHGLTNNANSFIGGIVGSVSSKNATVENCSNKGEIYGKGKYVGGILGSGAEHSKIADCVNYASVKTETGYCGGIAGACNPYSEYDNCINYGIITANDEVAGGIVGVLYEYSKMDSCKNYSNITGLNEVGGIVGSSNMNGEITNCYNSGIVKSSEYGSGGIVGVIAYSDSLASDGGLISNCVNTGLIEGAEDVGGIVGYSAHYGSVIEKSYNVGKVTGSSNNVGGIAGFIEHGSVIRNCYNSQEITAQSNIGGIVGYTDMGVNEDGTAYDGEKCQIINSYSIKKIIGDSYIGGIIGYNDSESCTITNSYYLEGTASLDEGTGTASDLMKNSEYIKTTFLTTANETEEIWEIREGENEGYPVIKGLK